VNRNGGLIVVSHPLEQGAVVRITNIRSQVSCSFEVVMRATSSLSGNPEWGVKCLEPDLEIWGVHFPTRKEDPSHASLVHVLLECQGCFSREMAGLTVRQYHELQARSYLSRPCRKCGPVADWKFASVEVVLEETSLGRPAPTASGLTPHSQVERRGDKRLAVKLPLGVRLPDGREETTTTENISKSGLCFACSLQIQIGDTAYVSVGLDPPAEQRDIPARIMWRRPAQGKGRAFYGAKLESGE